MFLLYTTNKHEICIPEITRIYKKLNFNKKIIKKISNLFIKFNLNNLLKLVQKTSYQANYYKNKEKNELYLSFKGIVVLRLNFDDFSQIRLIEIFPCIL